MGTFLSLGIKKGEIRSRPSPASGERLQTILLDARSCEFVAINATCVAINARGALAWPGLRPQPAGKLSLDTMMPIRVVGAIAPLFRISSHKFEAFIAVLFLFLIPVRRVPLVHD